MHLNSSFRPLLMIAAVSTLGVSTLTTPTLANAELSGSVGVANLYLFRGQNLSNSAPQVHGSLDYENTGFYAGIWGSSEGSFGQEYDLYTGYKGEMNGLSYNFNLTAYEYPQDPADGNSNTLGDTSEFILSLGFGGFGLSIVDGLNSTDYMYYSFSFDTENFGVLAGIYDNKDADTTATPPPNAEYTHVDLNFYATDELTFTLSTVVDDDPEGTTDHDTLFVVGWTKSFDL